MNYKFCTKCGKKLEATTEFFYKAARGKFGVRTECIKCANKIGRKYHNNNPDYAKTRAKKWRANNVEHVKEYNKIHGKDYYKNNKEKCNEKSRKYYQENREKNIGLL